MRAQPRACRVCENSKGVYVTDLSVATLVGGAQPAGSFYLTYHCESRVVPVGVAATTGSPLALVSNASNATVGDVLRVNTGSAQAFLGAQGGGASFAYYMVTRVERVAGQLKVTLDKDFADASGDFVGDLGKFYSNATDPYGVSEACYGADPETTLRIDHNASADYLREKLEVTRGPANFAFIHERTTITLPRIFLGLRAWSTDAFFCRALFPCARPAANVCMCA